MKSGVPSVDKRIKRKENKTNNILNYDVDNLYPQRTKDIINSSGTATRSVEVFSKFIIGGGFKDSLFYKSVINSKGLTTDKLLRYSANDYANFGGKAYHVNYNGLLKVSEVSHVPFENCRIGIGDKVGMIGIYDNWDCELGKFDASKIQWFHRFTSKKEAILIQIELSGGIENYQGQILYPDKYPLSPIDPILEDVISDKSIKTFTKKELDNGFNPSVIARYSKPFDGEEGQKEFDETLEDYRKFQGPDNTGKILVVSGVTNDDFDIKRLDSSGADKMYDVTEKRVKNSIIQRFGQPPSIVGKRDQNATFSSQNIEDDYKFYNSVTADDRLIFEEDFKLLFSNFAYTINETGDYSILELSFDEKTSLVSRIGLEGVKEIGVILSSQMDNIQK